MEPAWSFEQSIECRAPRSFAWSFWSDVSNWERLEGDAVEYIRIEGPFEAGSTGATKMPGQDPHYWTISHLEDGISGTVDMPLEGALFKTKITFESTDEDRTSIKQQMSLSGPKANDMAPGMTIFEESAPLGLAKLSNAIEAAYKHYSSSEL